MSNIDKQTLAELRKRYTPPEIPKCSICGGELSIQRCGGGEPTVYACDGYEADPENPGMVRRAAGRDIADKHYEESRYIDWKKGGDSDVVALLDELEAAEKRIAELEAVKFKLSDSKLLSLAKDIVDNLVDTGASEPEYTQQYIDWTCKRIRAAAAGKGE
ncbi:ead/Ea22-like family protein (plasmid) [Enterobacter ludwigii]